MNEMPTKEEIIEEIEESIEKWTTYGTYDALEKCLTVGDRGMHWKWELWQSCGYCRISSLISYTIDHDKKEDCQFCRLKEVEMCAIALDEDSSMRILRILFSNSDRDEYEELREKLVAKMRADLADIERGEDYVNWEVEKCQ